MNQENKKLSVSIAMCTYNGEKFVKEQIESIINQTYNIDEIIIVDDCSTDKTINILKEILESSNIDYTICINEKNLGVKKSFEKCINMCTKDIIFTADQDDIWNHNKLSIMMKSFCKNNNLVLAFCNGELVDEKGESLGQTMHQYLKLKEMGIVPGFKKSVYKKRLCYSWIVSGNMMGFRRKLIEKAFPISENKVWIHDSWLAITAPIFGDIELIDKCLIKYRQHSNNVIGIKKEVRKKNELRIKKVQNMLFLFGFQLDRMKSFEDRMSDYMDKEDSNLVKTYINLYREGLEYTKWTGVKKAIYLIKKIIDNKLSLVDISRIDVLFYLYWVITRKI